jgi:hypothetical protein
VLVTKHHYLFENCKILKQVKFLSARQARVNKVFVLFKTIPALLNPCHMHGLTLVCCLLVLIVGYAYAGTVALYYYINIWDGTYYCSGIQLREIKRKDLNFTKPAKVYSSEWAIHIDDGKSPSALEEYVQNKFRYKIEEENI